MATNYYRSAMAPIVRSLAANLIVCLAAAGCSMTGSVGPLEGILVMVQSPEACLEPNGDLAVGDNCGRLTVIETGGLVRIGTQGVTKNLGTVPTELMDSLETAIASTDFDAVRVLPWEGECPENDLGWRLVTYEFFVVGGQQRLASCGTEIDRAHPLFVALAGALRAVGEPLPVPPT